MVLWGACIRVGGVGGVFLGIFCFVFLLLFIFYFDLFVGFSKKKKKEQAGWVARRIWEEQLIRIYYMKN